MEALVAKPLFCLSKQQVFQTSVGKDHGGFLATAVVV
jgi:hypothetical protein